MTEIPIDLWLPRFTERLRHLCPHIASADAIAIALAVYEIAGDRDPEDVAADYATGEPSSDARH
jgi:hypothetical protein